MSADMSINLYEDTRSSFQTQTRSLERLLKDTGVTPMALLLLSKLESTPLTKGELASKVGVTLPQITSLCIGLEKLGLTSEKYHKQDRRSKVVTITTRGKSFLENL